MAKNGMAFKNSILLKMESEVTWVYWKCYHWLGWI